MNQSFLGSSKISELASDPTHGNRSPDKSFQGQIKQFEKKNMNVANRMMQQLRAAKEFEQFYHDQKRLQDLKK